MAQLIIFILLNIHLFANKANVIKKFLVRLQENWKSIVDNFQEGIIIFNKDFKILYMNNSMKTIFGTMCQDKAMIINRENDNVSP